MVAGIVRLITGATARWVGISPDGDGPVPPQRVYFANHQSHLDAPVIWASLPPTLRRHARPLAAKDYWEAGPLRRWMASRLMNAVLIERLKVSAREGCNPLAAIESALNDGASLILFPQGTRSYSEDDDMGPFKPGLFHIARRFPHVQLVPVYLENLSRMLPKGELIFVPLLASVFFGPPIALLPDEDRSAFLARARAAIESLCPDPTEAAK